MKKLIFKICVLVLGKKKMLVFLKLLSSFSRKISYIVHKTQFRFEWGSAQTPEWFDHYMDQFYLFRSTQNPLWLERGTFNLLAIKQNAKVLELCCGDGYNSFHFYSIRAKSIVSVDFDTTAINHAKKYNQATNVEFLLCDIRTQLPNDRYDNILWDAGIAHFTEHEIDELMVNIKNRLNEHGILSGYTIVEKLEGKSLAQHEYEFKSKDDLVRFFVPHFRNIKVFETIYPSRHNLFFWVSDGILPFDCDWGAVSSHK
jgi:SAM-dependent methyltransferase